MTITIWLWVPGLLRHATLEQIRAGVADEVGAIQGVALHGYSRN